MPSEPAPPGGPGSPGDDPGGATCRPPQRLPQMVPRDAGAATVGGTVDGAAEPVTGLFADHTLEFPGGYTRSTGPVIGRFLTELRDGRIVGVAAPDGRVLVPPLEYDPAGLSTSASLAGAANGAQPTGADGAAPAPPAVGSYRFVPVGPAGTVTAWAWVTEPRKVHPLRQPFGWALIRMDGADTALLHAVDTGGQEKALRTGLRVRPRWRAASERTGHIRDIECFVPEVTMLTAPSRVDYRLPAGRALSRFLEGIAQGKFLGHRCGVCGKVYVPLRGLCPVCGVPTTEEVEVPERRDDHHVRREQHPGPARAAGAVRGRPHPARRRGHRDPRAGRRCAGGPGPDGDAGAGRVAAARGVGAVHGQHQVVRADRRGRGAWSPRAGVRGSPLMAPRDVAVVAFAQTKHAAADSGLSETEMLQPVIAEVLGQAGLTGAKIGFTCSGSCDYLAGAPFSFVSALDAVGAWPPISESHVEMDAAWALYEAWVRLQHGDIDSALVYGFGKSTQGELREIMTLQLDPYYLAPLGPDQVSLAALQACAYLEASGHTPRDLAEVAARSLRSAAANPYAVPAEPLTVDEVLAQPPAVAPLRPADCAPITDGAAAIVLAAGDLAHRVRARPAWIRGIDHRIEAHYLGVRDLTRSESTELAARAASAFGPRGPAGVLLGPPRPLSRTWLSCTPSSATRN